MPLAAVDLCVRVHITTDTHLHISKTVTKNPGAAHPAFESLHWIIKMAIEAGVMQRKHPVLLWCLRIFCQNIFIFKKYVLYIHLSGDCVCVTEQLRESEDSFRELALPST